MSFLNTCLLILLFNILFYILIYLIIVIYIYFNDSKDLYEEEEIQLEELTNSEKNHDFGPIYNLPPEKHYSKKHKKKHHHKKHHKKKHHKKSKKHHHKK